MPLSEFLDARLKVVQSLTYGQLDHRARSIAARLLERGLGRGADRVSFPPGLDLVAAYLRCL